MNVTKKTTGNHWPVDVKLIESESILEICWEDEHLSRFPLRYLRGYCPCATCQGHDPGPPTFVDNTDEGIVDVHPVGNYAIQIIWDSGHTTGMYTFDYLRGLCPSRKAYAYPDLLVQPHPERGKS